VPRHAPPLLVAALLVLGVGCTDDPRELESDDLRRLIERGLEEADQENALHFTDDAAGCVAERVMRAISDDRLRELGIDEGFGLSTLRFDADEQDVAFGALQGCVDLVGQVAATIEEDGGLAEEQARCVAEGYVASDPFREAVFAADFDPALNERIDDALALAGQACGLAGPT
jgi:hypothetical protein